MNKLFIGKMAKLNNISVQTLRHYDKIGILTPLFIDDESGYRYYHIKQSAKLDLIHYMKCLGMSLDQIKLQFERRNVNFIQDMIKVQKIWIDEKIQELNNMKYAVIRCEENLTRYANAPKDDSIFIEHIPERKIFCYDVGINIYDHNLETYEYILRELKKQVILKNLPMVYFCNVGSILRKKDLDNDNFYSSEIFLFLENNFPEFDGVEIIPENKFVCICCNSFHKEKEYAFKLFDYIQKNNIEVIGDYICEVVTEVPIFEPEERNMFIKLQIPVKTS